MRALAVGSLVLSMTAGVMANDVTWTITGTSSVNAGEDVTWSASVTVTGANQGLAGYAFHVVVGPSPGPNPGNDGQWGTADDENLADVQLTVASFEPSFQVAGSSPPPGSVADTGDQGGPGLDVLPQGGTNTLLNGELLQVGASYLDWAAFPGSDGQTAGVGLDSEKANLLDNPAGDYTLHAGLIPTAGLPAGDYTVMLVPVTARTLRSDLSFSADHPGFVAQAANGIGDAFEFTVTAPFIPGDFDDDTDVDDDDLMVFALCFTGPTVLYDPQALPPGCTLVPDIDGFIEADFDRNGDVSHGDFGTFQRCISGDGNPGDPNCAD